MTRAMQRTLALCADDFGLNAGVSAGIARLARAGRLSAVSCMSNGASWAADAPLLRELPASVDVGLHFNLTEGRPASAPLARVWPMLPALPRLIALAHLRRLPQAALRGELDAQLAAFVEAHGAPPRFIDGHQHVHHLPGVREVVLDAASQLRPRPALRSTGRVIGPGFPVKRALIERTGGRALQRLLARRALPHNPALLGVYDFADPDYRALMRRWLAAVPPEGALLFCHPGEPPVGTADADAIAPARLRELAYLASSAFVQDLAEAGVALGRVWQEPSTAGKGDGLEEMAGDEARGPR